MTTIQTIANQVNLKVFTWSPGDGWTRYKITTPAADDYFAASDDHILFIGTKKEALTWLEGYKCAHNAKGSTP